MDGHASQDMADMVISDFVEDLLGFSTSQRPHTTLGGQPPAVVYFDHIETDHQVQPVA